MSDWQRWVRQPQNVWLRKAVFQVHLWTGLIVALYIVMLSVTGSVLVYRVEMSAAFMGPIPTLDPARRQLSADELKAAAQRAYPGWNVTSVQTRMSRRDPVAVIRVEHAGDKKQRRFHPYTGADLGDSYPRGIRALNWVAELHDDLLFGKKGRAANGVGSFVALLLALSGAIVWWPGVKLWRRSLQVKRGLSWIRFNWDLHSAMGAWFFVVVVLWCVSGVYFAWPELFMAVVDRFSDPEVVLGQRPGDLVIEWMVRLHFGRFRDAPYLQALWFAAGLVPAALAFTGVLMWWNRVVRKRLRWANDIVRGTEREVA